MTEKTNYAVGDMLDVKIEKIVPRGFGLGFAEKLTVFVPLAVTGDRLRVKIHHLKKRIAFAEIVEVLVPSPDRIAPPCPHFGVCGGCNFQQMTYEAQLQAKVGIIRDSLSRIGKIEVGDELTIIPSPQQFGYRSRARWHAVRDSQKIGYFARDSHDIIDVATCPILVAKLEETLLNLRKDTRWRDVMAGNAEIDASVANDDAVSIYSLDLVEPTNEITFNHDGIEYAFSARNFFQGNQSLIGQLIEAAIGDAAGETAIDLYSGVGLFTLQLAKNFQRVIGVEENAEAVRFAKQNKARAGLSNADFKRIGVREFLSGHNVSNTDFILIDPPRAGAENGVIQRLAKLRPRSISYVSCEPSILARDLRVLLDGGYRIDAMTALDLFPQTHHVETVVRLAAG